jgi:pimeloyl-ACP methyl ester carboxylesterase
MRSHLQALLLTSALSSVALAIAPPTSAIAQQPSQKPTSYRSTPIPCPALTGPDEVEGKTVDCGVVTVPENYSQPQGRQVEITYVRLRSKSLSPQPDPVVVLHGGPGGSDLSALTYMISLYPQQRQSRDVYLFDQRGSRYSGDLACTPSMFIITQVFNDPKNELTQKFVSFAEKFKDPIVDPDGQTMASFNICASVLKLHGFDLNQYNTTNNARDVVSLASTLGYDQINLYGISYGTFLAMRVMRDHPQRLRSVVLDSTIPPQVRKYEVILRDMEVSLLNLLEDCQQDQTCNQAYPNLKTRAIALLQTLDKKPIPLPSIDKTKPAASVTVAAFETLVVKMNSDPRIPEYLPLIVAELEKGVTTTYVGVTTGKIFTTPAPKPNPISEPQALLAKGEELRQQARKLLSEKATFLESRRPSQQWVKQVLNAIETLPEKKRPLARGNFYGVGYTQAAPRDRATLSGIIAEILPGAPGGVLIKSLQTQSDVEIRHIYEVIATIFRDSKLLDQGTSEGSFRTFDCQDLVPLSNPDRTEATFKQMVMPELGRSRLLAARQAYALCKAWLVKPDPTSDGQVVKSSIPTLVLQGRYDVQTNSTVGQQAIAGLTKGVYLEFPKAGHGVLQFSQCAKDVGAAFVNNPTQLPNANCREALKPRFVLPTPAK